MSIRVHSARTTTNRLPQFATAAACSLAILLAGCSASASEPAAATSGDQTAIDELQRVLFGTGGDPTDAEAKQAVADNLAYEERLQVCMTAAGFEYSLPEIDVTSYQANEPDYFSREYAENYGFGYTTQLDDPAMMANSYEDPNADYLASLSPGEADQYYVALYGDQSFWDDIESEEERIELERTQPELFAPRGCQADANSAQSNASQAFYTEHGDEISELYTTAESSPIVQLALQEWSSCMADKGYSFTTPDDFDSIMDPYMEDLYSTAVNPGEGLTDEDFAKMSEDELNELWSTPSQYDPVLLAQAQDFETTLAVASWDCGQTDLYEAYQLAVDELMDKYVSDNFAELQALVAS